jgi:hypothetical protein
MGSLRQQRLDFYEQLPVAVAGFFEKRGTLRSLALEGFGVEVFDESGAFRRHCKWSRILIGRL